MSEKTRDMVYDTIMDLTKAVNEVRSDIKDLLTEINGLREEISNVRSEINDLRKDMHTRFNRMESDFDFVRFKLFETEKELHIMKKR